MRRRVSRSRRSSCGVDAAVDDRDRRRLRGPALAESCCRLDVCCHISRVLVRRRAQRRVRRDRGDSAPPREPNDLPAGERCGNAVDGAEPPAELCGVCRESRLHRRHSVADRGRARASAALHDHAERRIEAAPSQRRAGSAEQSDCLQLEFRRVQSSLRRPQWPSAPMPQRACRRAQPSAATAVASTARRSWSCA